MKLQRYFAPVLMVAALVCVPLSVSAQDKPQTREGFWFSAGLGMGSLGCDGCDTRESGLSGGLSVGTTLSPKFLVGIGTTGWTKTDAGVRLSAGTLDARVRFYPSVTNGFFVTGGAGLGTVQVAASGESASKSGVGAVFGLGYDYRIRPNMSITPYFNGVGISYKDATTNESTTTNFGQFGLALTLH